MTAELNFSPLWFQLNREDQKSQAAYQNYLQTKPQEFRGGKKALGKSEDALLSQRGWAWLQTAPISWASPRLGFRAAAPRPAGHPEGNPKRTSTSD